MSTREATLLAATAADLMQTNVVVLDASMPVADAFRIFEEDRISGAPVVDATGKLVGFLSSRDLTRSEHLDEDRMRSQPGERELAAFDDDDDTGRYPDKENYSPEVVGQTVVQDWMTPEVVSVAPELSLPELCREMVDRGIHRVIVVSEGRVRGIVSTFDVVRHFATQT